MLLQWLGNVLNCSSGRVSGCSHEKLVLSSICWINSSHLSAHRFLVRQARPSVVFSLALQLSSLLPCKISPTLLAICAPPLLRSITLFGVIFQTSLLPSHLHIFLPQVCPRCCPSRSPRRSRSPRCGWSPRWRTSSSTQHHQQPQATADTGPSRGGELDVASDEAVCETQPLKHLEVQRFFWNTDSLTYKMFSSCFPWRHLCLLTNSGLHRNYQIFASCSLWWLSPVLFFIFLELCLSPSSSLLPNKCLLIPAGVR